MILDLYRRSVRQSPLHALGCIGACDIESARGMRRALQRNIETSMVHQGEHRLQPLARLANQFRLGAVENHLAGRRGMQTHFLLDARDGNAIAGSVRLFRGAQEQRETLDAVVGGSRENEMQDTFAGVLIAT